jgi:hypothetical protein
MLDPAYLQSLASTLTWVDWIIVGIPAFCVLMGLLRGGTSVMYFGLVRLLTAWPLATVPTLYVVYYQKQAVERLALQLGLTPIMATVIINAIVFVIALIVIYRVLGLLWGGLRRVLATSTIGEVIDRVFGIPAGLFAGALLCFLLAVVPGVQFRSTLPQADQPPGLRNSVLLAMAEEQLRGLARFVPPPN